MQDKNDQEELDALIICPKCHTLSKRVPLSEGERALCKGCGATLYREDSRMLQKGLALSLSGLIFFALANLFPLMSLRLLGKEESIGIPQTAYILFQNGFYFVSTFVFMLIFLFPLALFLAQTLLFFLMLKRRAKALAHFTLVWLSLSHTWNMADIFFISILVALVKLVGYAQVHLGIAFFSLLLFVAIDLYMTYTMPPMQLWELYEKRFGARQ